MSKQNPSDFIKEAISDSVESGEIRHTNVIGDVEDLREWISEAWGGDYDIAEEDSDDPTERVYDVWGWTETTPEGEQDWRIKVKLHMPDHMGEEDERAWPGRA